MTYAKARQYMNDLSKKGIVLGTGPMLNLLKELENPQDKLSFIHVAGTNGKGSVCEFISAILGCAGLCVGHYLSPTLFSYEERWQVVKDNRRHLMKQAELPVYVEQCQNAINRMKERNEPLPTAFEVETAISFLYFVDKKCDTVVLEVGLGGSEDATNCVRNVLANVITPISNDHSHILGKFPEQIAKAKAGIIKNNSPVIMAHQQDDVVTIIRERAKQYEAKIIETSNYTLRKSDPLNGNSFTYKQLMFHTKMSGRHQIENCCVAIETVIALRNHFAISDEDMIRGVAKAYHLGRCDCISKDPVIIVDGAHNPAGANVLSNMLDLIDESTNWIGVMGVFKDKDYQGILKIMSRHLSSLYTIKASGERGLDAKTLADVAKGSVAQVNPVENVKQAMELSIALAKEKQSKIVVFGSLSFLDEVYNYRALS